ncbi:hypothetical protein AB0I85_19420 [Micromonospora echinofusca]|uniref:hypothetical protein n=1 Tax=Micromonospora echinofusca TaxID=47858 RepID=UPI0020211B36|nr:hypothetical protein [Micromonospora sp. MSM11]MCL7458183.1 hypothetical protein [Micromonospora sp. MSM11]
MQTITVLGRVVAILFAAHAVWVLVWIIVAARAVRDRPAAPAAPPADLPVIVVMLPALREQRLVRETLESFATARYPGTLISVAITSERETAERAAQEAALPAVVSELRGLARRGSRERALEKVLAPSVIAATLDELERTSPDEWPGVLRRAFDATPTTEELCRRITAELNGRPGTHRSCHVHFPHTDGRKGSQLNYAVELLPELLPGVDPDSVYLAVYDFDAVAHGETFVAVGDLVRAAVAAGRRPPALLHQVQLPLRFRAPFAPGADGALMRGQVLYWLRRGLAVEVGRILQNDLLRRSPRLVRLLAAPFRPMIYAIGSGTFVHLGAWRELGPFPEMQEPVGHRASLLGVEQALVPSFNLTEPYYQTRSMMNGWANVCYGSLGVARELDHVRPYPSPVSRPGKWLLVAKELFDIGIWFAGVLLIPAGLVITATGGGWWTVLAVGAGLVAYPLTAVLLLALLPRLGGIDRQDRSVSWLTGRRPRLTLVATFVAAPFVSATGPWLMFLRMLRSWRVGTPVLSGKTER